MKKYILIMSMIPVILFSQEYNEITLSSVCSENPDSTRRWRVHNPYNEEVVIQYDVYSNEEQGDVRLNPSKDYSGYTYFETRTVPGDNTVRIFYNNNPLDVKASSGEKCVSQNPSISGDIDGDNLVLIYDAHLILAFVKGWKTIDELPENFKISADIDKDGQVSIDDFWLLREKILADD